MVGQYDVKSRFNNAVCLRVDPVPMRASLFSSNKDLEIVSKPFCKRISQSIVTPVQRTACFTDGCVVAFVVQQGIANGVSSDQIKAEKQGANVKAC